MGATPPWRRLGLVGGRRATNGTEAARKRSILTLTDRIALPVWESREGCRRQELELRVSDRLLSLGGAGRRFDALGARSSLLTITHSDALALAEVLLLGA